MNGFVRSFKRGLLAAGVLAGLGAATPALAMTQAGMLQCDIAPGVGFVVGSNRTLTCVYRPDRGRPQYYTGNISRIGVDVGATAGVQVQWAVLTTAPMRVASLAGSFAGPGGGLTFGAGIGGNALVGGAGSSISLQPLSMATAQGFNLTAGIGALTLEPAAGPAGPMHHRMHRHMHHHRYNG
jgi:hypothetical protein